jgi:spore photoproduct lyase
VFVTSSARAWPHGRAIAERAAALGAAVVELKGDRLPSLADPDPRRAYREAKGTLAVVTAPPGKRRLQPIPPSAAMGGSTSPRAAQRTASTATSPAR